MTADEVIESYVRDVAACLPRRMRQDTALELKALLTDDLVAHAQSLGLSPDREMAIALVRGFGRPSEAARRYHERPALIDAADTHHFLIWALGGTVALAILMALDGGRELGQDLFLQWLGLLVIIFALAAWCRRHWPDALRWTPRPDPDLRSRPLAVLACAATLAFPVFMYAAPETFVRTLFLGNIPTDGLALTEAFRLSGLRILTLGLLAASALLYVVVALQGRRVGWSRAVELVLTGLLGLLFPAHAAIGVFASETANSIGGPIFGLIGAIYLLTLMYEAWHEWTRVSLSRPASAKGEPGTVPHGLA